MFCCCCRPLLHTFIKAMNSIVPKSGRWPGTIHVRVEAGHNPLPAMRHNHPAHEGIFCCLGATLLNASLFDPSKSPTP